MGKKGLQKSLRRYLTKLKKVPSHLHIPSSSHANWLLTACKYPRTPSFAAARGHRADPSGSNSAPDPPPAATLSDIDRFLRENFHSLYARQGDASDDEEDSPPAAAARCPPERFFAREEDKSRGDTSSLSSWSSDGGDPDAASGGGGGDGGVPVMTFSKDPYGDFRRSMQGMVEARHVGRSRALDWDFMEEMLFCYLELNDRSVHKYILRAFTDLTVTFRLTRRRRATAAGNRGRSRKVVESWRTVVPCPRPAAE